MRLFCRRKRTQRIAFHDRDVHQGRTPFNATQATTETPDGMDAVGGFSLYTIRINPII